MIGIGSNTSQNIVYILRIFSLHLFEEHLLSTYSMIGTVQSSSDIVVEKYKNSAVTKHTFQLL